MLHAMVHKLHHQLCPSDQTASVETPICLCVCECVWMQSRWPSPRGFLEHSDTCCFSSCLLLSFTLSHILPPSHTCMHLKTQRFFWSVKQLVVSAISLQSFRQTGAFRVWNQKRKQLFSVRSRKAEQICLYDVAAFNLTIWWRKGRSNWVFYFGEPKICGVKYGCWPESSLLWYFECILLASWLKFLLVDLCYLVSNHS